MTEKPMNGHPSADSFNPEQLAARLIHETMNVMIRGLVSQLPAVNFAIVLVNICRSIGVACSMLYRADDPAHVMKFRTACEKAFKDGLYSMPAMPATSVEQQESAPAA